MGEIDTYTNGSEAGQPAAGFRGWQACSKDGGESIISDVGRSGRIFIR